MHDLKTTIRRPRPGTSLVVLCCALIVAFVPGCSTFSGEKKKAPADPILGEIHPQQTQPYGPVPPPPKTNTEGSKTSAVVPPPPDPLVGPSPTSNAYLASITKPLPGSTPLAINDGQAPGAFQLTANAQPIVQAVPKDPAFTSNTWVAPPTGSGATGTGSFTSQPQNFVDPQVALLQARGITQQRFDPQPNGSVRLLAVAPRPDSPGQVRTFDVTARDPAAAVQAVLQQMDQK